MLINNFARSCWHGRTAMSKTAVIIVSTLGVGLVVGIAVGGRLMNPAEAQAPATSFSAVPGAVGEQDISGPYQVQQGWPKDLATLPGHDKWTYGSARGIFAESPNRVFLLGGAELPAMRRPPTKLHPEIGPNVQLPVPGLPWRNANTASPPGAGGSRQDPEKGIELWRGAPGPFPRGALATPPPPPPLLCCAPRNTTPERPRTL